MRHRLVALFQLNQKTFITFCRSRAKTSHDKTSLQAVQVGLPQTVKLLKLSNSDQGRSHGAEASLTMKMCLDKMVNICVLETKNKLATKNLRKINTVVSKSLYKMGKLLFRNI